MSQKQLRKPKYRNDIYYRHTPTRYAVALVDTDRFAATIDKVFQDGAEGAVRGDAHIFYCRGEQPSRSRHRSPLGLLKAF